MAVKKGRVIARQLVIEVEGKPYKIVPGSLVGPPLAELAGKSVEVLMVGESVLAIRPVQEERRTRRPKCSRTDLGSFSALPGVNLRQIRVRTARSYRRGKVAPRHYPWR